MKRFVQALILVMNSVITSCVLAESPWYPFPVEIANAYNSPASNKTLINYQPLARVSQKWHIHIYFPHMKDSYWLAVNFGIVKEAERLGIEMMLYEAGGYDQLPVQISQLTSSTLAGVDGVIIGAISYDGLNDTIARLHNRHIPVIDVVNGISSDLVSAHSLVSFEDMGYSAGEYLARQHPKGSAPVKVAWFPGPEGAGWVMAGNKGFHNALMNSAVQIVATRYGDTGNAAQTKLLEDELQRHPDIDYIAGTAVTASAAVTLLRKLNLNHRINIISYYFTPDVYKNINRGKILAAPTDSPVIQGRIAVDQLVRILEHKAYSKVVSPRIQLIDQSNVDTIDRNASMAPAGFRATYSLNTLASLGQPGKMK